MDRRQEIEQLIKAKREELLTMPQRKDMQIKITKIMCGKAAYQEVQKNLKDFLRIPWWKRPFMSVKNYGAFPIVKATNEDQKFDIWIAVDRRIKVDPMKLGIK